ncbi:SRPBCC family protein [Halomonas sp. LR3S48]|uniref:SRPBCC family protein n=1 Tax=Halomonas sp. LR3S48 TaxID=2982694 RepID=UPI0021E35B13|nr:SRPBCC family protein [Halomonas sp. LR3S48]UYG05442.1 SRPBCC family protein [Halomonas sp. LR3S48]
MTPRSDLTVHEVVLPLSRDQAFQLFTKRFAAWWPAEYTWSQSTLDTIGIEPRQGGRCTEEGPHGFQVDWGRVLAWEPPERLLMTWQIGPNRVPQPDPAYASTVEVRFHENGPNATRLVLNHSDFRNHGDGAEEYRDAMASEYGWPYILECYRKLAMSQL